jgi:hypothetical protein
MFFIEVTNKYKKKKVGSRKYKNFAMLPTKFRVTFS